MERFCCIVEEWKPYSPEDEGQASESIKGHLHVRENFPWCDNAENGKHKKQIPIAAVMMM
jgi:hypothetical protein